MDIKSFTNWGGPGWRAGGIVRSEKWENHKNRTHTKIQFYIISMIFFFYDRYYNFYRWGGGEGQGACRGRYPFIKIRKSQEQYTY